MQLTGKPNLGNYLREKDATHSLKNTRVITILFCNHILKRKKKLRQKETIFWEQQNGAENSAQIMALSFRHPCKLFQQTMTSPEAGVSKWVDSQNKITLYLELCLSSKLHFIALIQSSKNCHGTVAYVDAISCKREG